MKRSKIALGVLAAFVCVALVVPSAGAGQVRRGQPSAEEKVDVVIALKIAGQPYDFTGKARGTHAPIASIYGVNAQQWSVEHGEDSRSVRMTFWRPASGSGDMFNLYCTIGGKSYHVTTVKTKNGGEVHGSGTVTFTPAPPGGTFKIDAKTADGAAVTGTIKCGAFTAPVVEGG